MSLNTAIRRVPAVLEVVGCSKSTLYQHMAEGLWPRPVRISERSVGWPESEIQALLAARIAGWSDERIKRLVAELVGKRTQTVI
jgi:prophage regulatory protein